MHAEAFEFGRRMLATLPVPQSVLEIGSRDINGSLRSILPDVAYIGIDLKIGDGVDVVANGVTYQPEGSPDLIICTEVLEHTAAARAIVLHIGEILAQGGHLLLTCATSYRVAHSAVDGGPLRSDEYYGNVDPLSMDIWLDKAGLTTMVAEVWSDRGDLYVLAVKQ